MTATPFPDLFSLRGKRAVVTGGSRGIGAMIARGLLDAGAEVLISSRKEHELEAARASLAEHGTVHAVRADVSTVEGAEALAEAITAVFPSLDILVNNAGATWGMPLDDFDEHAWDKVMDTNVKGYFFLTQKLLPLLRSAASHDDPARVINVGSIDGIKIPVFDTFSYGPSKAAAHHLTRMLAAHLVKQNILVNAIAPGPFPTWMLSTGVGGGGDVEHTDWDAVAERNPRGRVGTPEDVAGIAIFLSSRAGAFTVGEVITCDGGSVVSA